MTKYFTIESIRKFLDKAFSKLEIKPEIYRPVIKCLINTSLRGVDSHGIRLAPHYIKEVMSGRINKNPKLDFKQTSKTTCVLDAGDSFGITASILAMKKAIKMAKENGMGSVSVINSTHFGAAANYSLIAAENNMIGFSFTNTDSLVVPYGSKKPFLGTNPICVAMPCEGEDPFCLDMATSTVSLNKIRLYKGQNKMLEEGWAVDENGESCIDPNKDINLVHFGGYKGYGISVMIEMLCTVLTGMPFDPDVTSMFGTLEGKRKLGHFFMVIDISKFQDVDLFKKRNKELMIRLRNSPVKKGVDKILVSGDPEKINFEIRSKKGIPLSDEDFNKYIEVANLLKINKDFVYKEVLE